MKTLILFQHQQLLKPHHRLHKCHYLAGLPPNIHRFTSSHFHRHFLFVLYLYFYISIFVSVIIWPYCRILFFHIFLFIFQYLQNVISLLNCPPNIYRFTSSYSNIQCFIFSYLYFHTYFLNFSYLRFHRIKRWVTLTFYIFY